MDDKFLYQYQKSPRSEFAEDLLEKLNQSDSQRLQTHRAWRPVLASAAAALVIVGLLSFPSVRVAAQRFLDLFRVQRFVAVSVDSARIAQLQQLQDGKIDFKEMLASDVEVLKEPGQPVHVQDALAASQKAGIDVRLPAALPKDVTQEGMAVTGEGMIRFTTDTTKLEHLLEALDINDVQVPHQLNGSTVTLHLPPCVTTTYVKGEKHAVLLQARSPEIALPAGVFLPQLAEIGLRIAGLAPDQARRLAYSMDWQSTLLLPVPADASSFREVDLGGTKALLIETRFRPGRGATDHHHYEFRSMLLWADGGKVYTLAGTLGALELLEMANSL